MIPHVSYVLRTNVKGWRTRICHQTLILSCSSVEGRKEGRTNGQMREEEEEGKRERGRGRGGEGNCCSLSPQLLQETER